jgi:hypothetical protein
MCYYIGEPGSVSGVQDGVNWNAGGIRTMKKAFLIFVAVLAVAAAASWAGNLPPEFTYIIYFQGKDAGRSTTKITETENSYVFESQTVVNTERFNLDLSTKTEVDKLSFLPLNFTYVGERRGEEVSGETKVTGTNATTVVTADGEAYSSTRSSKHPILILEDYVMAHEVVIARAFWEAGAEPTSYSVLFPSMGNVANCEIEKDSELSFESETKETYCVKFIVRLQNSTPFASFYDPERGLPVYLAFPGTDTEVFLDEFFDGKPISRYRSQ